MDTFFLKGQYMNKYFSAKEADEVGPLLVLVKIFRKLPREEQLDSLAVIASVVHQYKLSTKSFPSALRKVLLPVLSCLRAARKAKWRAISDSKWELKQDKHAAERVLRRERKADKIIHRSEYLYAEHNQNV